MVYVVVTRGVHRVARKMLSIDGKLQMPKFVRKDHTSKARGCTPNSSHSSPAKMVDHEMFQFKGSVVVKGYGTVEMPLWISHSAGAFAGVLVNSNAYELRVLSGASGVVFASSIPANSVRPVAQAPLAVDFDALDADVLRRRIEQAQFELAVHRQANGEQVLAVRHVQYYNHAGQPTASIPVAGNFERAVNPVALVLKLAAQLRGQASLRDLNVNHILPVFSIHQSASAMSSELRIFACNVDRALRSRFGAADGTPMQTQALRRSRLHQNMHYLLLNEASDTAELFDGEEPDAPSSPSSARSPDAAQPTDAKQHRYRPRHTPITPDRHSSDLDSSLDSASRPPTSSPPRTPLRLPERGSPLPQPHRAAECTPGPNKGGGGGEPVDFMSPIGTVPETPRDVEVGTPMTRRKPPQYPRSAFAARPAEGRTAMKPLCYQGGLPAPSRRSRQSVVRLAGGGDGCLQVAEIAYCRCAEGTLQTSTEYHLLQRLAGEIPASTDGRGDMGARHVAAALECDCQTAARSCRRELPQVDLTAVLQLEMPVCWSK